MSSPEAEVRPAGRTSPSTTGCIAVVNAGSSSIKFGLYAVGPDQPMLFRGQLEQIGVSPRLKVTSADGAPVVERNWTSADLDHTSATREVLVTAVELMAGAPVSGVGHRVVHGGTEFAAPILLNGKVIEALAKLTPLAPLHQPHNLASIEAIAEAAPHIPQVACFDTAFHRTQPPVAELFGLPRRFAEAGVLRYGFHGLSYEYVAGRLKEIAPELSQGRVIVAHLGSGASLCALDAGRSVATTMGFTGLDGLVMGTRCGALDPGVLIYLMDAHAMSAREIEDLVYRQSGLLGISGLSSDMRTLRASREPAAALAISMFIYCVVREVGSMTAALGGLDGLVFTAGIGENDPATRAEVAAGCRWLGLELDPARNAHGVGRISSDASAVEAWVIPTDEEGMIARHASRVLGLQ
jgi:acetate kinase